MARKAEVGIEYFPMNTDIITNPKVKLVVAEFGSKTTWAVLLPLYCKIYREKGYWMDWLNEDSKLLFAQDECKLDLTVVNELVNGCIRRSLFDKGVFDMFGVLTSDRIQENYLTAKARSKEVNFIEEFAVKNEKDEFVYKLFQNVHIIDLNVNIITKKVDTGTQKKNKKKITEGEGESGKPPAYTPEEESFFKNFQTFIKESAPNVGKMKEPFTIDQYLKIRKDYSKEAIKEMILKMHNYKPLVQKNICAYLTFINWSKKDFNGSGAAEPPIGNNNLSKAVKQINDGVAK